LKAARGGLTLPDGGTNEAPRRRRPWGDDDAVASNWSHDDGFDDLAPVGSFPRDVSPLGVFDVAGNVTEWTSTPASSAAYLGLRIVRGGNWDTKPGEPDSSLDFENTRPALAIDYGVGFRCARTP
jgi:iron(II)-dependent oxidoreductase